LFVACGLVLGTVACGGTTATTAQPQISDATAVGDAICTGMLADQKALVAQFKSQHPNPSKDDATDFLVNTLIPRLERAVGDFHRVGEPTKDRQKWDDIVKNLDEDVAALKTAAGKDPVQAVDSKPFADVSDAFTNFGFKECPKVSK
jgi:hypothetical protein